VVETLAGEYR